MDVVSTEVEVQVRTLTTSKHPMQSSISATSKINSVSGILFVSWPVSIPQIQHSRKCFGFLDLVSWFTSRILGSRRILYLQIFCGPIIIIHPDFGVKEQIKYICNIYTRPFVANCKHQYKHQLLSSNTFSLKPQMGINLPLQNYFHVVGACE